MIPKDKSGQKVFGLKYKETEKDAYKDVFSYQMKKPIHNQFITEMNEREEKVVDKKLEKTGNSPIKQQNQDPITNLLGLQSKEILKGSENSLMKAQKDIAKEMTGLANKDILARSNKKSESPTKRNNLDLEIGVPDQR